MLKVASIILTNLLVFSTFAQSISVEQLQPLPEAVTNNAVALAYNNDGDPVIYSFAGIDSTKACGAAHLRCFALDYNNQLWTRVSDLPQSTSGVVATGASTVKNKIYVFGGYNIRIDCSEVTSWRTNIFDPIINDFVAPGQSMLKPVDDHVQAVYKDSLIYIISGWSNTTNVVDVQIYDPQLDFWSEGTPIPNSNNWKVFGASGSIVGDTIYFAGGAQPFCSGPTNCFKPTKYFRKGIINPNDPNEITWIDEFNEDAIGYRMGASTYQNKPIWIGGSSNTYNFDGIAYDNSGGVQPNLAIKLYDPPTGQLVHFDNILPPIMDLRGIAKLSENEYIICGGMKNDQIVTNEVLLLKIDELSNTSIPIYHDLKILNNPTIDKIEFNQSIKGSYQLVSKHGLVVQEGNIDGHQLNVDGLNSGLYFLKIYDGLSLKVVVLK